MFKMSFLTSIQHTLKALLVNVRFKKSYFSC